MATKKNLCIQFVQKQKAALVECDWDDAPLAADEVLGKTLASLVSSGSERGAYMDYYGGAQYPMSTGYATIMEVLETGQAVKDFKKGDLVFNTAPHNLYNRVKAENCVLMPAGMAPERAVMGRIPAIAMTTLIETQIRPTEPVIITGLGIVGLMAAEVFAHGGYEVYGIDPVESRRETARACGIGHVLSKLADAPELKGRAGLALECSGFEQAAIDSFDYIRKGGELSLVGVPWFRSTDADAHTLFLKIFYGYVHVYSGWEWSLPRHPAEFLPNSNYGSFGKAMEWIRDGYLKVDGVYQLESPRNCDRVYNEISTGKLKTTCAIFDWRGL